MFGRHAIGPSVARRIRFLASSPCPRDWIRAGPVRSGGSLGASLLGAPAVLADERDEDTPSRGLAPQLPVVVRNDRQVLAPSAANGCNETAAFCELLYPGIGNARGARSDDHAIVRRSLRIAKAAIPDEHVDIMVAEIRQDGSCAVGERRKTLDGDDVAS